MLCIAFFRSLAATVPDPSNISFEDIAEGLVTLLGAIAE